MPVTRSELLFLCGGAVAGAIGAKHFDKIKARVAPWLATAGEAAGDAYTAAARRGRRADGGGPGRDGRSEARRRVPRRGRPAARGPVAAAANGTHG